MIMPSKFLEIYNLSYFFISEIGPTSLAAAAEVVEAKVSVALESVEVVFGGCSCKLTAESSLGTKLLAVSR